MYLKNLFVAIDQLVGTLVGGDPDVTISSHIHSMTKISPKWCWLERVVDATFAPLDGVGHCRQAYAGDNDVDLTNNYYLVCVVVIVTCTLLWPFIRVCAVCND